MPAKKTPKRDACYRKVKRAMPKITAHRSGHMVRCHRVSAENYNIGGKKVAKSDGLGKWFSCNKGKGWVNCKTGGPCGRKSWKSGGSYPACRPTIAQCKCAKGNSATRKKNFMKVGKFEGLAS